MKKYDLIIFGATGFTGKLICDYILNHKESKKLKIALAARNKNKLNRLTKKFNNINPDVLVVDSFNHDSIDQMTLSAKLIITVVGPYSLYGEYLVDSCIKHGTHYLDLTGEPSFVFNIRKKYQNKDIQSLIINSCGLESIIPDVGTFITVNQMNSSKKDVTYYLKSNGQISGGTWASLINAIYSGKPIIEKQKKSSNYKKDKKIFYNKEFKSWAVLFPVIDKYIVNQTGKKMKQYGNNFSFNEYILLKPLWAVIFLILGLSFINLCSKLNIFKKLLLSLKPSGSGPNESQRNKHWFQAIFVGEGENERVVTKLSGGDPGYGETAKFISEIALCILNQFNQLNKQSGIRTPVECTGDLMVKRLKNAGIKFE